MTRTKFTGYQKFVIAMLAFLQFTIVLDFMILSPLGAVLKARAQQRAALALADVTPDDDVDAAGLVFERDEDDALGGLGLLAHRDDAAGPGARRGAQFPDHPELVLRQAQGEREKDAPACNPNRSPPHRQPAPRRHAAARPAPVARAHKNPSAAS